MYKINKLTVCSHLFAIPALLFILLSVSTAYAAVDVFTDRTAWLTAIGGTPSAMEDFEGFVQDTEFRSQPVSIAVGTLEQQGVDESFRNLIDTIPFEFTDNNGTNHASMFANAPEVGITPGTTPVLNFISPVTAWGADFVGTLGGELLAIVVDESGSTLATINSPQSDTFIGFIATAGEQVTAVQFTTQTVSPGGAGEGFGMDNIAILQGNITQSIPSLNQWGLFLMILLMAAMVIGFKRKQTLQEQDEPSAKA